MKLSPSPTWPQTPIAVQGEINTAIAKANAALDAIGKQDLSKVTLANTIGALDNVQTKQRSRSEDSRNPADEPQPAMREAAEKAIKVFEDRAVGIDHREDVTRQ